MNWDIMRYQISTGVKTKLNTKAGQYSNPTVDANGALWYDRTNYGFMIYYDFSTGRESGIGEGRFPVLVGRVIKVVYSDGQQTRYSYDFIGRRTEMTDSTGTTRYTNDALNRLTEVIDARGNNIRYEWDHMDNRTRVIYPDNSSVRYGYDVLGRVTEVRDASNGSTT